MPSPFPGMDPWVESPRVFPDLRFCFIVRLSTELNRVLPEQLYARFGFRIWYEPTSYRRTVPDAVVADKSVLGPATIPMDPVLWDERREGYVEVRSGGTDSPKVWTRLDMPSRENKTVGHPSRVLYHCRQHEDLWEGVNRVEIELLREGEPTTLAPVGQLPRAPADAPYHVCVHRVTDEHCLTVYQFELADPWPHVAVPIGEGYADVVVDLAAVFDDVYRGGAYERWMRYNRPCDPPLTPEQQAWAEGILRTKGLIP